MQQSDNPQDSRAAYDLIADMYCWQFQAAAAMLEENQKLVDRCLAIGRRHKAPKSATLRSVVEKAAKAGDKEAISLLASGALERRCPSDEARQIVARLKATKEPEAVH
jgi:hypothetical protein